MDSIVQRLDDNIQQVK